MGKEPSILKLETLKSTNQKSYTKDENHENIVRLKIVSISSRCR
ncbi:unnamed protein product [Larinioides sclopetarius]|uniref:Ribosomal protein S15 n=1 Tax=Larinioides sclopetarius TaxID=280406 RepID=A0AAV1Z828_9ARAC